MAAAIYAGRSQRDTLVVEKGGYGGRVKDTGEIRNYPGTISDSGQGLMENSICMHRAIPPWNSAAPQ